MLQTDDSAIHIMPSLSPYSIKNGETLTLTAVIKSRLPVQSVAVDLGGIDTITLYPDEKRGGVSADRTTGLWSGEWVGFDLEEKIYTATISVVDVAGNVYTDSSLEFSDPAAGNSTVGTMAYPNGGMQLAGSVEFATANERQLRAAVIDLENDFAYFATRTQPASVIKVALGDGNEPPYRVSAVLLETNEDDIATGFIDATNGYMYFGTDTTPGKIIKVATTPGNQPPIRIGALTLSGEETNLSISAGDPENGFGYFVTGTRPASLIKVALGQDDDLPTVVGSLELDAALGYIGALAIDTVNGHAYLGTSDYIGSLGSYSPAILKYALGSGNDLPLFLGSTSTAGLGRPNAVGILLDVPNGYGYALTSAFWFGSPFTRHVVKFSLGSGVNPPVAINYLELPLGVNLDGPSAIDPSRQVAYLSSSNFLMPVSKISLGVGSAPPMYIGSPTLSGENPLFYSMVIAPEKGYLFTGELAGRVLKVRLNAPTEIPTIESNATLDGGELSPLRAIVDSDNQFLYAGTGTNPGRIVRFDTSDPMNPPSRVDAIWLAPGEDMPASAVVDTVNGYAYFGTRTSPGRVVKVALGSSTTSHYRVGTVTLEDGENNLDTAVIDIDAGYAYFMTRTSPARVVKVSLGAGDSLPTRVGALTLATDENNAASAVINPAAGYLYVGTNTTPGKVVKVSVGSGANMPTRIGTLTLPSGENSLQSAIIDVADNAAYFGTNTSPAKVIKVNLGAGSSLPARAAALTLPNDVGPLRSAVVDQARGHAWFVAVDRIAKVGFNSGANAPIFLGSMAISSGHTPTYDPATGYGYFLASGAPSTLHRIALSQGSTGSIHGSRMFLPEDADEVHSVKFYSHGASGNLRLSIYDDAEPKNLLWTSGVIPNTAVNSELDVPISIGTPSTLKLDAGTYWLAWQSDSWDHVGSYTTMAPFDGFQYRQTFGGEPNTLNASSLIANNGKWTQYIVYSNMEAVEPPTRVDDWFVE